MTLRLAGRLSMATMAILAVAAFSGPTATATAATGAQGSQRVGRPDRDLLSREWNKPWEAGVLTLPPEPVGRTGIGTSSRAGLCPAPQTCAPSSVQCRPSLFSGQRTVVAR